MNTDIINQYILDAIDKMIHERFKKLSKFNYYIEAKIETVNEDGTYDIEFQETVLKNIKAREGLTLNVGDIVLVTIVNGNFSNKFIDCKRP